jgi:hypothetical protein
MLICGCVFQSVDDLADLQINTLSSVLLYKKTHLLCFQPLRLQFNFEHYVETVSDLMAFLICCICMSLGLNASGGSDFMAPYFVSQICCSCWRFHTSGSIDQGC